MSLLARFDPGGAMAGQLLIVLLQTSVVIVLAALWGHTAFRRRPEARHALWLSVLVMVLVSPAIAAAARQYRFALWAINLPDRENTESHALVAQRPSDAKPRWDRLRPAAETTPIHIRAERSLLEETAAVNADGPRGPEALVAGTSPVVRGRSPLMGALVLLWAAGALVGVARIAVLWNRTHTLYRATGELDPARHGATLERVRDALGAVSLRPVLTSTAVQAPVTVGVLDPRVILPTGLAEALASDALRDVLAHEFAHIIRRDAWVGLLQRLVSAIFWPHPLVHYASGQLTRAREEVCDNYVLRCGDPHGYARTLLALTERCWPLGAMRPGLGLLGMRWTLADRVAGLLDTRRVPMIRTTFRIKIGVGVSLALTVLGSASVRIDRSARAEGVQAKPVEARAAAARGVWGVEGTVVDERGQPVAGAAVRVSASGGADISSTTAADGTFTIALGGRTSFFRGIVAETDGGARIGLARFPDARMLGANNRVKIALKPSRRVQVHVRDAAGSPVTGAAVAAIGLCFRTSAATGPQGTASLQVAADAKVEWVIGLKSGSGFDYFENYRARPASDYPPLPAEVSLTLDGAQTVRVRAVDMSGQPVPGVSFGAWAIYKTGKVDRVVTIRSDTVRVVTDQQGVATCAWLPNGVGSVEFHIPTDGNYSCQQLPRYVHGESRDLTAHLLRETRLSGTVRLPDGRPAEGILIKAQGGPRAGMEIIRAARTLADGSYVLDAPSETTYIVGATDEAWAARSLVNVIVREGQAQSGLDFTLTKGTLVHGRISEPPDHRPATGARVWLFEEGGPLVENLRRSGFWPAKLSHRVTADVEGRYHFRVSPGRYFLQSFNAGGTERLQLDVKNEAEVVRDLTLKGPVRDTYFSGVVVEQTPAGDRPVAGALVFRWKIGADKSSYGSSRADEQGRFQMLRIPGEWVLYARTSDLPLAGVTTLPAELENVRVVVAKTPRISGRVVDSNGKAVPHWRATTYEIYSGTDRVRSGHERFGLSTDEQGRFQILAAPVGSRVEITALYPRKPDSITPRIVANIVVRDANPIEVPDLIVPAEKPAN